MNLKRISTVFLVLLLAFAIVAFSGCSKKDGNKDGDIKETTGDQDSQTGDGGDGAAIGFGGLTVDNVEESNPLAKMVHLSAALTLDMQATIPEIQRIEQAGLSSPRSRSQMAGDIVEYAWYIYQQENDKIDFTTGSDTDGEYYKVPASAVNSMIARGFSSKAIADKAEYLGSRQYSMDDAGNYKLRGFKPWRTPTLSSFTMGSVEVDGILTFTLDNSDSSDPAGKQYRVIYQKGTDGVYRLLDMTGAEISQEVSDKEDWEEGLIEITDHQDVQYIIGSVGSSVVALKDSGGTITVTAFSSKDFSVVNQIQLTGGSPTYYIKNNNLFLLFTNQIIVLDGGLSKVHDEAVPLDKITDEAVNQLLGYDVSTTFNRYVFATNNGLYVYDKTEPKVYHIDSDVVSDPRFTTDNTRVYALNPSGSDFNFYDFQSQERGNTSDDVNFQVISSKHSCMGNYFGRLGLDVYLGATKYLTTAKSSEGNVIIKTGDINSPNLTEAKDVVTTDGIEKYQLLENGRVVFTQNRDGGVRVFITE